MSMNAQKILVVDRSPAFRDTIREYLEMHGYQVLVAADPSSARESVERENPALVITELRLHDECDEKDVSGLALATQINPSIPKIILTSFPSWEAVRASLTPSPSSGFPAAVSFITKQEGLNSLLTTIGSALERLDPLSESKLLRSLHLPALRAADRKVFISYALADKPLAKKVQATLEGAGIQVWDADREILPGDNWAEKVGHALEESDAMVVLLTPDSVESPIVKKDIQYAISNPAYAQRLIPVLVGDPEKIPREKIPWILRRLNMITLPDKERNEGIEQIVEALKSVA